MKRVRDVTRMLQEDLNGVSAVDILAAEPQQLRQKSEISFGRLPTELIKLHIIMARYLHQQGLITVAMRGIPVDRNLVITSDAAIKPEQLVSELSKYESLSGITSNLLRLLLCQSFPELVHTNATALRKGWELVVVDASDFICQCPVCTSKRTKSLSIDQLIESEHSVD